MLNNLDGFSSFSFPVAWSRNLEHGIIQAWSYWCVFGFLWEMLPAAEQAVSLHLKGNEAYSIKVSVNPSLITFEPDGQFEKKKKLQRDGSLCSPKFLKAFRKAANTKRRTKYCIPRGGDKWAQVTWCVWPARQLLSSGAARELVSWCSQGIITPAVQNQPQHTLSLALPMAGNWRQSGEKKGLRCTKGKKAKC